MANILNAIKNVVENPITEIKAYYNERNRANSAGDSLEYYVRDSFTGGFDLDAEGKLLLNSREFSYIGNNSTPPDLILRGGDAIETKKIESKGTSLALNSSYPKSKLFADSTMLTADCVHCEEWTEKDMIYSIGYMNKNTLKYLYFIYGDCYCADKYIYERLKNGIKEGVSQIGNITFTDTNELGKVKRVDPLGITDLRVRGMWNIENPRKVFSYLNFVKDGNDFQFVTLMRKSKFESFDKEDRQSVISLQVEGLTIKEVKVANPNNPAQLLDCILFTYYR